jgi:hypothetical protein
MKGKNNYPEGIYIIDFHIFFHRRWAGIDISFFRPEKRKTNIQ